jgi:low temperature requirement protein LtrA
VLIALGESIVEIAAGSHDNVTAGVVIAAIVSIIVSAELWWLYFDVVALVAARRLQSAAPGREQNAIARDSFTYLHEPMVAGIVLVALGFEETIGDVGGHLHRIPAVALLGGVALYLFAHVAFRWRNVRRVGQARLLVGGIALAAIPLAGHVPALATLIGVAVVLLVLVGHERRRFAELRRRLRHPVPA